MGHRHHRKHGCRDRHCEICIPGLAVPGMASPFIAQAMAAQGLVAPAFAPQTVDVLAANGTLLNPQLRPLAAASLLAPQPTLAQVQMAQYATLRSAAGFPVSTIVAPVGFKAKKIRKRKTRTIVARPDTFFSGKAIFISKCVAKHFDICSLRVGQFYVFGGKDPVPAEMFSNDGCGGSAVISLPAVAPGQHIYLTVRNHDCHSHWFRAAINGLALV